mgnify:FL=1
MPLYPLTPSQLNNVSVSDALAFIKSPTLMARRLSEILNAQEFIGLSLLTGRYTMEGGVIAVPKNEVIRADRSAETVAPGAEYKLTPLSKEQYDLYMASKRGLATEVTDEEVGRSKMRPIEDAAQFLKNELLFDANSLALAAITSKVTATIAASAVWNTGTPGKVIIKDVLRAQAQAKMLKLGFNIDTVVLPADDYAVVMPEIFDFLQRGSGTMPDLLNVAWLSTSDANFTNPLLLDRQRLGGIGREDIPSPEYRQVPDMNGINIGIELAVLRTPTADKTRLQARFPHAPIVVNPSAGLFITGTGL